MARCWQAQPTKVKQLILRLSLDNEILVLPHHASEVIQWHISPAAGVDEPPVGELPNDDRLFRLRHQLLNQDGPIESGDVVASAGIDDDESHAQLCHRHEIVAVR
jgi:hypothetical protein